MEEDIIIIVNSYSIMYKNTFRVTSPIDVYRTFDFDKNYIHNPNVLIEPNKTIDFLTDRNQ